MIEELCYLTLMNAAILNKLSKEDLAKILIGERRL
jgi:hypothetical protein